MKGLNRFAALLLALCMLLSCAALAEENTAEDEEITIEEVMLTDEGEEIPVEPGEDDEEGELVIGEEAQEALAELEMGEVDDSINPDDLELNPNLPDNVVNILMIGVDTRSTSLDDGLQHGDVQIILSVNKDTGDVKLTSLMRDLYVTLPGYKNKNRINVAYAYGGGALAMRTVNRLLDMNIEHYVVINFYGLASIIDAIGGVDIDLTRKEASAINTYLHKHPPKYDNTDGSARVALEKKDGVQHLDGIQAVMYARVRSIDNDFERTARQRHLLELLLQKVMQDMSVDKLLSLMDVCLPYVKTNMSAMDMFSLATGVLNSDIIARAQAGESLLTQMRVPMDETWKYYTTEGGSSVIAFRNTKRLNENVEGVHNFIYGDYYPAE